MFSHFTSRITSAVINSVTFVLGEAQRTVNEYKFKLKKAEQDITQLDGTVSENILNCTLVDLVRPEINYEMVHHLTQSVILSISVNLGDKIREPSKEV